MFAYDNATPREIEIWANRQKTALLESIKHWKENAQYWKKGEYDSMDMSCLTCPCCVLVNRYLEDCEGCPIYEYTGKPDCYGTPYNEVAAGGKNPKILVKWLRQLYNGENPEVY